MNHKKGYIGALFVLVSTITSAQQNQTALTANNLHEVVVSDSKFDLEKEKSGKVITKITAEELKQKSGQSIAAILSGVAGVEINGNQSVAGKNLGYYIRGGKNDQELILIDGIPVTDASGINFQYDLNLLPADQVESIEVMKGAASTLYGSGAATGIINIVLKKSGQKSVEGTAYMQIGTNNTAHTKKTSGQDLNQGFSISGKGAKFHYYTSLNSTEVGGMSQIASPSEAVTYEEDRFSRINYLAQLGYHVSKKVDLDFFGSFDKINNDYDGTYDGTGTNDTNLNHSKSEQFRFGFLPKFHYRKGELVLNTSFNKIDRKYEEYDSYSNTVGLSLYHSRSINADVFNKYEIKKAFFIVVGNQYQFHDMSTDTPYGTLSRNTTKFAMIDPYFTGIYSTDFGLNLNVGARLDMHSQYGSQWVYNFNPSYDFKGLPLKVLGSISSAFVTPSLYQLYSQYGNSALTPEKNKTFELGFEAHLLHQLVRFNTVAFYREQTNFIGFYTNPVTFDGMYVNIDGMHKAKGIETELAFKLNSRLKWSSNYTFTQVDVALDRLIPKHKVNSSFDFQLNQRAFWTVSYQFLSNRNDVYFDGATYENKTVVLDSYQLVNTSFRYDLIVSRVTLFAGVTNLFNADFTENIGYSTRGRNFKIGLTTHL